MTDADVRPWQLWWVDFPFLDRPGSKIRPAIVVSPPTNDDVICMYVTSQIQKRRWDQILLDDWRSEGLERPSAVRFSKRAVVAVNQLSDCIGTLTDNDRKKIILASMRFPVQSR